MEKIKILLKKPVVGGVTVGVIAAATVAYMLYKRYT